MEGLSLINFEPANLKKALDAMMAPVQRIKDGDGKLVFNVSMNVQRTYENMVNASNLKL